MNAIINAELVMHDHLIPEAVLFIEDGKIAGFGEMRNTEIPEGCEIIDAKGAYVGPGLVDIHCHSGTGVRFIHDPVKATQEHLQNGTKPLAMLVGYVDEPDAYDLPIPNPEEATGDSFVSEIRPEDVPTGDSTEDRRARNRMIRQFYHQWMERYGDRKVFNKSLNDYIHVKYISVNETAGHASLRYLSTLAVLQLDAILPNAILQQSKPVNMKTKNQKGFKRMLIMEYVCPAIGLVRLTVGLKSSDDSKVQYCITAIEVSH